MKIRKLLSAIWIIQLIFFASLFLRCNSDDGSDGSSGSKLTFTVTGNITQTVEFDSINAFSNTVANTLCIRFTKTGNAWPALQINIRGTTGSTGLFAGDASPSADIQFEPGDGSIYSTYTTENFWVKIDTFDVNTGLSGSCKIMDSGTLTISGGGSETIELSPHYIVFTCGKVTVN
jgi:hypothetical protein